MPYSLRKGPTLGLLKTHSFYYSTNAAHSCGSIIWNNLPDVVKSGDSLFGYKKKTKYIGNIDCGCLISRDVWYTMFCFILWFSWNLLAKAILCTKIN